MDYKQQLKDRANRLFALCSSALTMASNVYGPLTDEARAELVKAFELSDKIHHGAYFGRQ